MSKETTRYVDRRTAIGILGAGGMAALAGCLGGSDEDIEELEQRIDELEGDLADQVAQLETRLDNIEAATDDPAVQADVDELRSDLQSLREETTTADEVQGIAAQIADLEAVLTDPSFQPGPQGERLSRDDIQALVDVFDDNPMNEAQRQIEGENRAYTPRHVWKWVSDESFIGLHFNEPNPEEATALDYITIGRKGLFTEESQPDVEFTHFHQHTADSWDAGHGGATGDEGYWLTHIATRHIQYPFHQDVIGPQVDYNFMPTPPESGTQGHDTDWTAPDGNEGSLSADGRDALLDIFDDQPFNPKQLEVAGHRRSYTPRHIWKWVNENVVLYLHFNDPNPEEATELDYFGIGIRGQFQDGDRPDGPPGTDREDFSHFHKHHADSWDAGHGGQHESQWGLWLIHHNVRPVNYPFHEDTIAIGVDREFMPTSP